MWPTVVALEQSRTGASQSPIFGVCFRRFSWRGAASGFLGEGPMTAFSPFASEELLM